MKQRPKFFISLLCAFSIFLSAAPVMAEENTEQIEIEEVAEEVTTNKTSEEDENTAEEQIEGAENEDIEEITPITEDENSLVPEETELPEPIAEVVGEQISETPQEDDSDQVPAESETEESIDMEDEVTIELEYEADSDAIASGEFGCRWQITDGGDFIIGEDEGECTLNDLSNTTSPWKDYKADIKSASFRGIVHAPKNINWLFENMVNMTSVDLTGLDTSETVNMQGLFQDCENLRAADLSMLDTHNVKYMHYMFWDNRKITDINLGAMDTANVTHMGDMFYGCHQLKEIDLSSFDTSNVVSMEGMFRECWTLDKIDISNFDLSKVRNMRIMFYDCRSLDELILPTAPKTESLTNLGAAFMKCYSLESLDLSAFDTSKVTSINIALDSMSNLKRIVLPETWKFDGDGTDSADRRAFINGKDADRKWVRVYDMNGNEVDDGIQYTAYELTEAWDGATMAGTWEWYEPKNVSEVRITTDNAFFFNAVAEKDGSYFAGWASEPDGEVVIPAGQAVVIDSAADLYAVWTDEQPMAALDINARLDGRYKGNTSGFALFDVYIDGQLVKADATDFYKKYPVGTTFELRNIRVLPGYRFDGMYPYRSYGGAIPMGCTEGTIAAGGTNDVAMKFVSDASAEASTAEPVVDHSGLDVLRMKNAGILSDDAADPNIEVIPGTGENVHVFARTKDKKNSSFRGWETYSEDLPWEGTEFYTNSIPYYTVYKEYHPIWNENVAVDVSARIDGRYKGNTSGYATFDVYINGDLVKDDVTDFYKKYPVGTEYEITDIKPAAGYEFDGVSSRPSYANCIPTETLQGTVFSGGINDIGLEFVTKAEEYTITVHANDGRAEGESVSYTREKGKYVYYSKSPFTRNGYLPRGWADTPDGAPTYYQGGYKVDFNEDKDLYVIWGKQTRLRITDSREDVYYNIYREGTKVNSNAADYYTPGIAAGTKVKVELTSYPEGTIPVWKLNGKEIIAAHGQYFCEFELEEIYTNRLIIEFAEPSGDSPFLGKWYAQGQNILWEVTVNDDWTFFNHYPNYSVGDMTYTWHLADDENTIVLFEDNYSFDEYGNLVDKAWNAQGINYAQRILTRIPNIMGWWRSEDSFIEGETYPDGIHGVSLHLNEHDYGKTFSLNSDGAIETFDTEDTNTYQYDVESDTIIATDKNGTQTVLHRWYDTTLR